MPTLSKPKATSLEDRLPMAHFYGTLPTDLVDAFRRNQVVVYVGAGASISAGLPSWDGLLNICLDEVRKRTNVDQRTIDRLKKERNLFMAAEWLKRCGNELNIKQILATYFENHSCVPSIVHHGVSRLAFRLVLTTNFDTLLEASCNPTYKMPIHTYQQTSAILSEIVNGRPAIIKIHGSVHDASTLVFTQSDVRALMYQSKTFNECLKTLLLTQKFFFIGSSLRDPDVIRLLDEVDYLSNGQHGPHFAILLGDECDKNYSDYLFENYKIKVFWIPEPEKQEKKLNWQTQLVSKLLRDISGKIAEESSNAVKAEWLHWEPFVLIDVAQQYLKFAIELTGSDLGTIGLLDDLRSQRLYKIGFSHNAAFGRDTNIKPTFENREQRRVFFGHSNRIYPKEELGDKFLQMNTPLFNNEVSDQTGDQAVDEVMKVMGDESGKSLFVPIFCAGQKAGILKVGSRMTNAFTKEHLKALQTIAEKVGSAYLAYHRRKESGRGLVPYLNNMKKFMDAMTITKELDDLHASILLYSIDYGSGIMQAHPWNLGPDAKQGEDPFTWEFKETSLATSVLKNCHRISIDDARKQNEPILGRRGVEHYNIQGAVRGIPIMVLGIISGVLVYWSNDGTNGKALVESECDKIERLANMLANSPDVDENYKLEERRGWMFLKALSETIELSPSRKWSRSGLKELDAATSASLQGKLLNLLVHEACGLARVRLWQVSKNENGKMELLDSSTSSGAEIDGIPLRGGYIGVENTFGNNYVRLALDRAEKDSLAFFESSATFGNSDSQCARLNKDPSGSWIVGPIVLKRASDFVPWGYITADNHYPVDSKIKSTPGIERHPGTRVWNFQRTCVDLVTCLMGELFQSTQEIGLDGQIS